MQVVDAVEDPQPAKCPCARAIYSDVDYKCIVIDVTGALEVGSTVSYLLEIPRIRVGEDRLLKHQMVSDGEASRHTDIPA